MHSSVSLTALNQAYVTPIIICKLSSTKNVIFTSQAALDKNYHVPGKLGYISNQFNIWLFNLVRPLLYTRDTNISPKKSYFC